MSCLQSKLLQTVWPCLSLVSLSQMWNVKAQPSAVSLCNGHIRLF